MQPLWKQRNFMLIWSGQLISWIGTQVSGIALPLIVLALTGSPAQAGAISAMRGIIYVLLALPAGALIDRWDKKTIMFLGNLGSGFAMGSIAISLFFHILTITQLYITGALEGGFFVFANIARFSSVPLVVTKEQLSAASSQISVADFFAMSVGPALGGIMYQTFGALFSFLTDGISYFINAFSIFFITSSLRSEKVNFQTRLHEEIHEGFLWFWHHHAIRFLTALYAGITIVAIGMYLLIIVIAKSYHASSISIGIILGISAGGGIFGAIVAPFIHKHFSFRKIIVISLISFSFVFGLFFFASNLLLLALVATLMNIIAPIFDVTIYSYTASAIPNEIRGRVTSVTRLSAWGAISLGYFLMGLSLQFLGITKTIAVFLGFLIFLSLLTLLNKTLKRV